MTRVLAIIATSWLWLGVAFAQQVTNSVSTTEIRAENICVTNFNGALKNGNQLTLWNCGGPEVVRTRQLWQLASDHTIRLGVDTRYCLTNSIDSREEGNAIVLWLCDGSMKSSQTWDITTLGKVQLAQHHDWCLDGNPRLDLMPCSGSRQQKWKVDTSPPVPDGDSGGGSSGEDNNLELQVLFSLLGIAGGIVSIILYCRFLTLRKKALEAGVGPAVEEGAEAVLGVPFFPAPSVATIASRQHDPEPGHPPGGSAQLDEEAAPGEGGAAATPDARAGAASGAAAEAAHESAGNNGAAPASADEVRVEMRG
eukprot:CAMPEP_0118935372 /NCGR_PEP_ID=MMETSP1169-20130426/15555_1 /TAXON_ID=36882 /ORGANISM="Pyramimonas obovata, Strain CCMP722" /LENGTH=309 /DNA_ID=CAMNT_0006878397 /DNA_START=146 /DNA_END=1071 /DNA_ORIENTATION=-